MAVEEARRIVRPFMERASSTPWALGKLERWYEQYDLQDADPAYRSFDPETRWAWLVDLRSGGYGQTQWPAMLRDALDRLVHRVTLKEDVDRELESARATALDYVYPADAPDPFGERWPSSSEGTGDDSYTLTDRPNHTLVRFDGGKPIYEPNERTDASKYVPEIKAILTLDAANQGYSSLDEYVASPGRGRASATVGARLDALSRSIRRLLDLGYSRQSIGLAIGRDKQRLNSLEKRTLV